MLVCVRVYLSVWTCVLVCAGVYLRVAVYWCALVFVGALVSVDV